MNAIDERFISRESGWLEAWLMTTVGTEYAFDLRTTKPKRRQQ